MREITLLSGKGGTGKTSLAAAFAALAGRTVVCDLDVDAPDLHLLLKPDRGEAHPFTAGQSATIDSAVCVGCGACADRCRFGAIRADGAVCSVVEPLCEGCGVCARVCPNGAVSLSDQAGGVWYRSRTAAGPMLHAEMEPGSENSGLLVTTLRREARCVAVAGGHDLILSDGPPGIGCPVISALTGTTLAVIVTEPTPSGRHDLERIADLCRHFGRPAAVVINKADLDPNAAAAIDETCASRGYPVAARLPFHPAVIEALSQGRRLSDVTECGIAEAVRSGWNTIRALAECCPAMPSDPC